MLHRRTIILVLTCLVLGVVLLGAGALWYLRAIARLNDSGSIELAKKWTADLKDISDPGDARKRIPKIQVSTFPNGEWMCGLSQDSHSLRPNGGGTMVIKDSRGKVRVFFGHVCGPGYLGVFGLGAKNLDDFYRNLLQERIVEHSLVEGEEAEGEGRLMIRRHDHQTTSEQCGIGLLVIRH